MKRWRVRKARYPESTRTGLPWQAWAIGCDATNCKCREFDTHEQAINHATNGDNQ